MRLGCECIFAICQERAPFPEEDEGGRAEPDEGGPADVMNRLVDFEVRVGHRIRTHRFGLWEPGEHIRVERHADEY